MSHKNPWPDEGNTGHIWDEDIRELDNPPPLWWMLAFYAGIVMIIFYATYYPAIPLSDSYTKGVAGWTQVKEYKGDLKVLSDWRKVKFSDKEEKLHSLPVTQILNDPEMKSYAVATSKMLFGDYCAACHGVGGQGNPNFPVLADDDWLWGGNISQIQAGITNGHSGNMPARGMMGNLTDEEISTVAEYAFALSNGKGEDPKYAEGKATYAKGMCMACHGPSGKPLAPIGAANLTDKIWRFAPNSNPNDKEMMAAYVKTIKYGVNVKSGGDYLAGTRRAEMPSFKERLPGGETDVKRLAVYVHALGGGQ